MHPVAGEPLVRDVLPLSTMHAIFFGLKRAFHGTLRVSRHALGTLGLTAARFDLLYGLYKEGDWGNRWQSHLRKKLGVSAQVVSRMLASLEVLGVVTRVRDSIDRRQRVVRLTTEGRRRIRLAIRRMIGWGQVKLAVDVALGGDRWFDWTHVLVATDTFESGLRAVRSCYRDTATLYYPWHPDD